MESHWVTCFIAFSKPSMEKCENTHFTLVYQNGFKMQYNSEEKTMPFYDDDDDLIMLAHNASVTH